MRHYPAEYGDTPEPPHVREFVYWNLIEYFNIHQDSELRFGGKRRGSRHTATLDDLHEYLQSRAEIHNQNHEPQVVLARAALPKVLLELSLLKNTQAAYMYSKITFFEARLYEPKDPSMTEEQYKAAGYKEELAKEVFMFAPSSHQA